MTARIQLGHTVMTPAARDALDASDVLASLRRHQSGDWGDVSPEDRRANDDALRHGDRILSVYSSNGTRFYIITEADRSSTCVLLPEEY